ncbi:peptidase S8 [Halocatena pleomorpha]|uniref:Peptidase S8 n=2 Tax=Halocatena pleomorpha TaxID=1785090 RepID=A0A3P3RLW6_9EURY|nr:peptidase S8 [Halocatena pleomorpha]
MSGLGLFSSIGRQLDVGIDSLIPVNIGYQDSSGYTAATEIADEVVRTFEFDAATVTIPQQLVTAQGIDGVLSDQPIRYIEPDRPMIAHQQYTPWGIDRSGAELAHTEGISGQDIDIAILDSGIDGTHPDLQANVGDGTSFLDTVGLLSEGGQSDETPIFDGVRSAFDATHGLLDTGSRGQSRPAAFNSSAPEWHDSVGHGTHIAGTVGAIDNSGGVVGVSPDATLHAIKVLSSSGVGSASDIAAGVDHVAKQGWEVANLSLGSSHDSKLIQDACSYAAEQGTLLVAATGNVGPCTDCVRYPAAYSSVVGVGATTTDDELASFSATGPEIDLVAPGQNIRSTYTTDVRPYETLSGTSMAAPHVAAAGGLLMADGYENTAAADRLIETAEDIGLSESDGGAGLLDIPAALGL